MVDIVGEYWKKGFSEKVVDQAIVDQLLQHCKQFPETSFNISFAQFLQIVKSRTDTAPGPDGVYYSTWKNAPDYLLHVLYDCYKSWINGDALPARFNHVFFVDFA